MMSPERAHDLTRLSIHYSVVLRSIAFWGHVIILWLLMRTSESDRFPYMPVLVIILTLGVFTLISTLWASRQQRVGNGFVFSQLMADVIFLTLLLYFTGGSSNPFVSLFMLPVTFAAALLKPFHIGIIALSSVVAYTGLMEFNQPMHVWMHHGHGFTLHVWGMWAGFLLSAGLVAYFVTRIGMTLRGRDQLLAETREKALEAEKVAALGALAAGTAHELGTPLGTIAILAKELERTCDEDAGKKKKMHLLRSQVDRCKTILSNMAITAGQAQADAGRPHAIRQWLEHLLHDWQGLRPTISLAIRFPETAPATAIIVDRTITQAIINVLNNAADAGASYAKQHNIDALVKVSLQADWDADQLTLLIQDEGDGLNENQLARLGAQPVSSEKSQQDDQVGLGLGLYLARTTLHRFDGDLIIRNRTDQHGADALIRLPLARLHATPSASEESTRIE